jgi:glycosyltransferase involved in cell wall biosynthesis
MLSLEVLAKRLDCLSLFMAEWSMAEMIRLNTHKKIAFVASYIPRKCGIATFTAHLVENVVSAAGFNCETSICAMQNGEDYRYGKPVEFLIRQDTRSDYLAAGDYINSGRYDAVSLQHEFGLFGGPGGSYINMLLRRLKVPVYTTLHTVLERPEADYFHSLIDVCDYSYKVIVMNTHGIDMLTDIYGISRRKIAFVPHGIPDIPFNQASCYKRKLELGGRKVILTFGLIGPNKGIDVMLKALPGIIKYHPGVLYVILGTTHPGVVRHSGYEYKNKLLHLIHSLGLKHHVLYLDRFATNEELRDYLAAADIYVTPYLYEQQLTSGTLAFAVGAGKAVVSTPYWAARELLADGRGILVSFGDSMQMASVITQLLNDEYLLNTMQWRAYEYGRTTTWPKIGQAYWNLIDGGFQYEPQPSAAAACLQDYTMAALRPTKDMTAAAG